MRDGRRSAAHKTLEYIWGRDCPNFGNGGFLALAESAGAARHGHQLQVGG